MSAGGAEGGRLGERIRHPWSGMVVAESRCGPRL